MFGHVINLPPARGMWLHCNLYLVSFLTITSDSLTLSLTHDLPPNNQAKKKCFFNLKIFCFGIPNMSGGEECELIKWWKSKRKTRGCCKEQCCKKKKIDEECKRINIRKIDGQEKGSQLDRCREKREIWSNIQVGWPCKKKKKKIPANEWMHSPWNLFIDVFIMHVREGMTSHASECMCLCVCVWPVHAGAKLHVECLCDILPCAVCPEDRESADWWKNICF